MSITINWVDNSTNEDGFKIERRIASTQFAEIATVGPDVTSYTDNAEPINEQVSYRVKSFNQYGDSAPSNEVTFATFGPTAPSGLVIV